jgi:hypothetical protein
MSPTPTRRLVATIPALLASALLTAAAAGQDGAASPDAPPPTPVPPDMAQAAEATTAEDTPRRLSFNVHSGAILTFQAGLDDSPGDVSIWRAGGGVGAGYWLTRQVRLGASFDTERSWYEFDNATGLIPGTDDPIDVAEETNVSARVLFIQNEEWAWFVGGRVTSGAEDGADFGDSITGGGVVGARWQMDPRFALNFGLAATTRLEEDPLVLPLIGFDWTINDKVRVSSTGPGVFDATDSLGARVFARVSDEVEVMLGGRWKLREYRLDESQTVASEGVLRDARFALDVGLLWKPADNISLGLIGGVIPWQEYGIDDEDGDEISEVNSDPAGFIAFGGRITF